MNWIPLFVIIPLGMAFIMPIISKLWKGLPDLAGNVVTAFLAGLSLWAIQFSSQTFTYYAGGWTPVDGVPIGIAMVFDGLTLIMLLIINIVAICATLYSVNYMKLYTEKGKYYTLFLLMVAGLNGVVLSGDLFNLFVFLEISAIASYALVAFGIESEELEASFKYQILGGTGSMLILLSIAIFYYLTGTLNLADASNILQSHVSHPAFYFCVVLLLVGFGLKAALMPFHSWLPDAHPSAPAPISAMLSGVVIKVLGVYAMIRIFFNVFGLSTNQFFMNILLTLGLLSMVAGAFLALGQEDLKRLLAYSSISQIGYIVFALGLGTNLGTLGAIFHMMNHAASKSLLFLNSGAVVYRTGSRHMPDLGGLSGPMPVTSATSLIGSFSISGLPPMGGFWSKLVIIWAAIESGHLILAIIAVLASIVTLAYYLKAQKLTFRGVLKDAYANLKEAPLLMSFTMVVMAIVALFLGLLLIPALKGIILDPAVAAIQGGLNYASLVLGG